jgi:hypothetical protein
MTHADALAIKAYLFSLPPVGSTARYVPRSPKTAIFFPGASSFLIPLWWAGSQNACYFLNYSHP